MGRISYLRLSYGSDYSGTGASICRTVKSLLRCGVVDYICQLRLMDSLSHTNSQ